MAIVRTLCEGDSSVLPESMISKCKTIVYTLMVELGRAALEAAVRENEAT